MMPTVFHRAGPLMMAALFLASGQAGAFTSLDIQTVTAGVTIGVGGTITIQTTPLGSQALYGKNMMLPVTLISSSGPINPNNLRVDIIYQLVDAAGQVVGPPIRVPIQFIPGQASGNTLQGTAVVSRSDLALVQAGGTIRYELRARQGASDAVLGSNGNNTVPSDTGILASPFQTSIISQFCAPVDPAGSRVSAPDLSSVDGQTAVTLPQGAIATPGTLCIQIDDAARFPVGPNGARSAAVYTITLQNTAIVSPVQLVLSYPSDQNGRVLGSGDDPHALGIYWLDDARLGGEWRVMSKANVDTTLHTLTGQTGHFSTFGLFAAGAIGSPGLRPSERIITPNGDGTNDRAVFGTGIEELKIFDIRGRRIRSIAGPTPVWDGTDDSGAIVESGVYLYQYTSSGDLVSGVIAVAK